MMNMAEGKMVRDGGMETEGAARVELDRDEGMHGVKWPSKYGIGSVKCGRMESERTVGTE